VVEVGEDAIVYRRSKHIHYIHVKTVKHCVDWSKNSYRSSCQRWAEQCRYCSVLLPGASHHCACTMCRHRGTDDNTDKDKRQQKLYSNMQDIRTGSLRPWIVILTDVGVLVVAVVLPAARVLPRCTRGCGRNKLRFAATRGALFTAERCSSAPPMVAAIVPLVSYCAAAVGITTVQARPQRRR
jgi:hypothetical protein